MELFLKIFKRLFYLPWWLVIVLTVGAIVMLFCVPFVTVHPVLYLFFCLFVCLYVALVLFIRIFHLKNVYQKIRGTSIGDKYFSSASFRMRISLWYGFLMNLFYIVMKLGSGIYYHSLWFVVLAFYYLILAVMRFSLARRAPQFSKR